MGVCCEHTAAVFHLMRVVEWGLRSFARHLGLLHVVADRKRGKIVPIEYSQWEKILSQLHEKVDAKIDSMRAGPKKQAAQEFYYSALSDVGGFKDAWRNHVMHGRKQYKSADGIAVLGHVERFMKTLADHEICEGRQRGKRSVKKP
jgi:hypothetical protein